MNKLFFIISILIYISNFIIVEICDITTQNTLWSALFFVALLTPLCIGCVVNAILYKQRESKLKYLFYYLSFMCSFGILLISILTSFILDNASHCWYVLSVYMLLDITSVMVYLIAPKNNCTKKQVYGYFSILFTLSLLIGIIILVVRI